MFEKLIEYKEMREAIRRIRTLAEYYDKKAYEANPIGYGEPLNDKNSVSYWNVSRAIWRALNDEEFI